jgi:hypothetical protein
LPVDPLLRYSLLVIHPSSGIIWFILEKSMGGERQAVHFISVTYITIFLSSIAEMKIEIKFGAWMKSKDRQGREEKGRPMMREISVRPRKETLNETVRLDDVLIIESAIFQRI